MRARIALLLLAAGMGAPSAAGAATTLGSDLSATPGPGPVCADRCTIARTTPAGTVSAPAAGVIVRWRIKSAGAATARLRVVRRVAPASYTAIASSADETLAAGVGVFSTRLAIAAGDRLAVDGAGAPPAFGGTGGFDVVAYAGGAFDDGQTLTVDATGAMDLLLNADVEPDADGDGFGDETQDACPHDATRRSACTSDLALTGSAPEYGVAGQTARHSYEVRERSGQGATGVVVTVPVPAGAAVTGVAPSRGTCTVAAAVRCALGTIAPGGAATVGVALTRPDPGRVTSVAHVVSDGADPVAADDDASASTLFTPPSIAPPPIALVGAPCANTITGTRDDEVIIGTDFGDKIFGLQGRDLVRAGSGDDCVAGNSGADVLDGDGGNDTLDGGLGDDRLLGQAGNDTLSGGLGNDHLAGGSGNDVLKPGRGRDRVLGGPGDDVVEARDGTRDNIDCGAGADTVRADRIDRVRNCERRAR